MRVAVVGTNVSGGNFVGGLVGEMIGGYINNSYFEGTVNGNIQLRGHRWAS
jgi:hypothetical protein